MSSLFKDGRPEPVFGTNFDEVETLRRYDAVLRVLVTRGTSKFIAEPFTVADIGGSKIQDSLVDYSVAYALSGSEYTNRIMINLQYTVLQAALILTITLTLFIDFPNVNDVNDARAFSAIIGFSASSHLTVLIGSTICTAIINSAYSETDAVVARVEAKNLLVVVTLFNYIANISAIVAMYIIAFDRDIVDGSVQLYMVVVILIIIWMFLSLVKRGVNYQDTRSFAFYSKYCDNNGELKDEYLRLIYGSKEAQNVEHVTCLIPK